MAAEYTHQTVRDYVAAKKRGDRATTDRIVAELDGFDYPAAA